MAFGALKSNRESDAQEMEESQKYNLEVKMIKSNSSEDYDFNPPTRSPAGLKPVSIEL